MIEQVFTLHVLNTVSDLTEGKKAQFKYKVPSVTNSRSKVPRILDIDTQTLPQMVQTSSDDPSVQCPNTLTKLVLNFQSGYTQGAVKEDDKIQYSLWLLTKQPLPNVTEVEQVCCAKAMSSPAVIPD